MRTCVLTGLLAALQDAWFGCELDSSAERLIAFCSQDGVFFPGEDFAGIAVDMEEPALALAWGARSSPIAWHSTIM